MVSDTKTKLEPEVCLSVEGVNKIYPGTKALDNVNFKIRKGKVSVLIGENGAGKSTLMKIISGIETPTTGKIFIGDNEVTFKNTTEARKYGIAIIHQELSLFPNSNVYQNMFMANEKVKGNIILDNKKHIELANKILNKLEHPINVNTIVGDLRVGQQQMIEIARNLIQDDLKILIMDEPTSSLSEQEVEVLFKIIRELKQEGIAIVYISHRLEELMRIGDYVTVLRDGKIVSEAETKNIDVPWIVENMVGKEKSYTKRKRNIDWEKKDVVLDVKNLTLPKKGGGYLLDNINFNLKRGEILGIYGLMGAGRTEIFECLMGLHPEHTGTISLNGETMNIRNVSEQIDRGIVLVPEDRQREGLIQTMDIGKNISLSSLKNYVKGIFIDKDKESENIDKQIKDINIKVADKKLPILSLSGGNQQKVVLGKGILTNPKILLLDEPSRGIDIGAKTEVFDIINKYADKGLSIIVISSELKEIKSIADRIIVLSNGIKTDEFSGDDITEDNLVLSSYKGHNK